MKKTLLLLIVGILTLNLSGCSKTSRFSISTEPVQENSVLTKLYEEMLINNGHSLTTEVPYDKFTIHLTMTSDGYDVWYFSYFINTGINDQEYEYTGYFCEENDNKDKLQCYTKNDEYFNKDYLNEQLEFSTILDTINEYEIIDVFNEIDDIHSVVLNQDGRILITVRYYDNETLDLDALKGVHYEDGVIHAEGELVLDGYYLQYTYYSNSGHNSFCHAFIKMTN